MKIHKINTQGIENINKVPHPVTYQST